MAAPGDLELRHDRQARRLSAQHDRQLAIASYGDYIYVITGNGVDDTHKHVVAPAAPAIVCFNKNTGKVIWTDNSPGANVLHGQWASVAIVEVNGRPLVIAPLGDAWVYAFDAKTGEIVWKFDTNPKDAVYPADPQRNHRHALHRRTDYMYIANGQDPEHGEGYGHMYCVDITKDGRRQRGTRRRPRRRQAQARRRTGRHPRRRPSRKGKPNPNSGVVWHFEQYDLNHDGKIDRAEHMNRTISTCRRHARRPLLRPRFLRFLHCLDAKTGQGLLDLRHGIGHVGLAAVRRRKDLRHRRRRRRSHLRGVEGDEEDRRARSSEPGQRQLLLAGVRQRRSVYLTTAITLFAIKNGAQSAQPKTERSQ